MNAVDALENALHNLRSGIREIRKKDLSTALLLLEVAESQLDRLTLTIIKKEEEA